MLLVKTKIKKSRIPNAGEGVFLKESVQKGQPIWVDSIYDIIISPETYEKIKETSSFYIDCYGTVNEDGTRYLDHDNCKYMNHSTCPNVKFFKRIGIALTDMCKGTELTCDYSLITTPEHFKELI